MSRFVLGVDVGTGSVRAGLFDARGKLHGMGVEPIRMWHPAPDFAEQSSDDIWRAVSVAIRSVLQSAGAAAEDVVGIGFDATCSLVVLDTKNRPLAVNEEHDNERNVIVWMDHRATAEADKINSGDYDILKYVGGRISPEMQIPKIKWIKNHLPDTWENSGKFLDLVDYLTYRASGVCARSLCTSVCKWLYLGHEGPQGHWDKSFLYFAGLADVFDRDRVNEDVRAMGLPLGKLTPTAAQELGLTPNCSVGVGAIDAHAGGIGLLGGVWHGHPHPSLSELETAAALIGGTSNCLMAVSCQPRYIDGIWGPYFGAMIPGMWLTEGGQSTAGSAIDHVITNHANAPQLRQRAAETGQTVYQILNAELARLQAERRVAFPALLTRDQHVLPYFLGNRAPNADPGATAVMDGLTLDDSLTSQALAYYATLQAVAYGTRDIIQSMNEKGFAIASLHVTGGGTKNPLWLQEQADATGLTLVLPREPEAVLLGAAMLAATAACVYPSIPVAMQQMSGIGQVVKPNPDTQAYHDAKFAVYRELYFDQLRRREYMAGF